MKRLTLYSIFVGCLLAVSGFLFSCSDLGWFAETECAVPDGERVVLEFMPSEVKRNLVRATDLKGTSFESEVEKLDLFVFDRNGNKVYDEQFLFEDNYPNQGQLVLNKSLTEFGQDQSYTLHLVANASSSFDRATIQTLDELLIATERNEQIHLTAIEGETRKRLVMYGASEPVVLNPSAGLTDNVHVQIPLVREAAKIILELVEGKKNGSEDFFQFDQGTTFRLGNLQATTRYIYSASELPGDELISTAFTSSCIDQSKVGQRDGDTIRIVTYAYPNNWNNEVAGRMTHIVVNIPYVGGSGNNNYYSIPITDAVELKANHVYTVQATIDAAGSSTDNIPKEIKGIYNVLQWVDHTVNIGGGDMPHYLTFDKDYLLMRGIRLDSVSFASSHEMEVVLDSAYFYNKYGELVSCKDNSDNTLLHIWRNSNNKSLEDSVRSITDIVTWKDYHGGFVRIECPMPLNNLPHRVRFIVRHKDCGVENCPLQSVIVFEQYPTEYISSYFGWHSYRDDFMGVTTFDNNGNPVNYTYPLSVTEKPTTPDWQKATTIKNLQTNAGKVVRLYVGPRVYYSGNDTVVDPNTVVRSYRAQRFNSDNNSGPGFFKSKVAKQPEDQDGSGTWWWARSWSTASSSSFNAPKISISQFGWRDGTFYLPTGESNNPRIYQINITSSKEPEYMIYPGYNQAEVPMDYDVTQPRLDENGYTVSTQENLRLVSPAFAVASRLGAVGATEDVTVEDETGKAVSQKVYKEKFHVVYLSTSEAERARSYEIAQEHCARYVEVYKQRDKNGKLIPGAPDIVLKDWRLPTPAELRILIYYEGKSDEKRDAMDYQLPANYFWTADPSGPVYNWNHSGDYNSTDVGLRCVHDMVELTGEIRSDY